MPAAIPIIAAVAAGAAASASMYVLAAVITVAGAVASMALTKTPNAGLDNYRGQSERKQVLRAAASPKTVVYGKTVTAGTLFFTEEQVGEQDNGELLYMAITLAGHPLHKIGNVYLADDLIGTYGSNADYEVHNNRQVVDPYMLKNAPSWKDDMIGKGIAWLRLTLMFDSEKFPSGIPNVKVEKWGWEVFDPRTGVTTWSDNAALVILHYYRYYLGVPDEEINWEQFKESANIADEQVHRTEGETESRYTINGEFDLSENKATVLDDLLASCAGEPTYIGGRHGLLVGAYYGPAIHEIHEDQIAGDIEIMPEVAQSERVNTINGTFIDPAQNYSEADFPAVAVPEWVTEDGVEIAQDMKLRFVVSEFHAQRLADIKLKRTRIARTINIPMNLSGYRYRPGMYVNLYIPSLGINGVEMRVTDWQFSITDGVKLTLKQESSDVWNDAIGKLIDRAPLTNLPSGAPGAPENLTYSTQIISDVVQGLLSWTTREIVAHFNVLFVQGGETVYTAQVPGNQCRVTGLPEGEYIAEVRAVAINGAQSVPAAITFKIHAPAAPDRIDVTPGLWSVELHPRVVAGLQSGTSFEFWYSYNRITDPGQIETSAEYLGRGASYTKVGLREVGKTYWFYVRSVNSYGASAFVEVGASVDSDVGPIFEEVAGIVMETPALKSLTGNVAFNTQQIAGGMRNSIEQAKAIISNSLANDAETRRWRAQNGERAAEITETRAVIANETEARTIAMLEMQSSLGTTNSNLISLQQTVATLDSTTSAQITNLNSQMTDAATGITANATAVQGLQTSVNNINGQLTAQALQINSLTSTVNGVTTEISDVSSIVNGINGQLDAYRSLKVGVDANGKQYLAGIGLGVSNTTEGMQSNIILLADRTSIMTNAGGTPTLIFTTQGTQAILNSVVIGDATINFAKIANDIQSAAKGYNNQPLWKFDKNGEAVFVSKLENGGYTIQQGGLYRVFDSTGFMVLRMGIWA